MNNKTLTLEERDAWRGFRRMADVISGRIAQDITRATGLSAADFGVLMQLDGMPDGQRQRDLQSFLEWDKTRLSHQLTRMANRMLIERESVSGGIVMIRMTAEGRSQLENAKPVHIESVRKYFLAPLAQEDLIHLNVIAQKLRLALFKIDA